MIKPNPIPLFYFTGSAYTGYYCLKTAYQAGKHGIQAVFGSKPLNDRIVDSLSDLQGGCFSLTKAIFGDESWKERTKHTIAASSNSVLSIAYGIFSYSFYYFATLPSSIDQKVLEQRDIELNQYQEHKNIAWEKYHYWTQNVCELEQEHWETVVPQVEACFEASSSWWSFSYSQIDTHCEKIFNQETFNQANRYFIPRDEVNLAQETLLKEKKALSLTCSAADYEIDKKVNMKCNAFYPFVTFESATMCPLLKWIPSKIDSECLSLCDDYLAQASIVRQALAEPLPSTKDLTLNCSKILDKPRQFSSNFIPSDKFLKPNSYLMNFLLQHKDEYKGYWNKGVHIHQDFNEEERKRVQKTLPWEEEGIDEGEKKFLKAIFLQRRRLIKDLEEKVKLKRLLEEEPLKGSERLKEAKMIYVN